MPQQKDIEYFTLLFNKEFSVWYDNKNLIRIIMYVISLLFIIYLFSLLLNLGKDTPVSGEENAYEIKSAEFEARLNNDGSAEITETWTVKSNRGASMEFIRQIEEPKHVYRKIMIERSEGTTAVSGMAVYQLPEEHRDQIELFFLPPRCCTVPALRPGFPHRSPPAPQRGSH